MKEWHFTFNDNQNENSEMSTMTETEVLLHMVSNDITMKECLETYRNLFQDCTIRMEECLDVLSSAKRHEYIQRFIVESVSCYLVTGFVVFRFYEIECGGTTKIVPIMVPISEIEWMYEKGEINYEADIVVPDVLIPSAGINNKTRFYVYKFKNHNGISSSSLGIVFPLVHAYRKWKEAEEYNIMLRKENVKTTVYVEQRVVADTNVSGNAGAHSVASAPLISRLTENLNFRTTTHAPVPPTQTEELRDSILEQITERDHTDFVIMPANTTAKINQTTHTFLDVDKYQSEYVEKMSKLMSLQCPSSSSSSGSSQGDAGKRQKVESSASTKPKSDSIDRLMQFTGKLSTISREFETMLVTINSFCDCGDVEGVIETYQKESIQRHKGVAKHRHALSVQRNSYAIPLQMLSLDISKQDCNITLSKETCTIFFSPVLYKQSFMSCDKFLSFVMRTTSIEGLKEQIQDAGVKKAPTPKKKTTTSKSSTKNSARVVGKN